MVFLSTILILSFIGAFDTKNIFKNYKTLLDDEDIQLADDRDVQFKVADDDMYELLGLVILDYDALTRRYMNTTYNMTDVGIARYDVDGDEGVIEPRAQSKHKKRKRAMERIKTQEHKKDSEEEKVKKKVEKKLKPIHMIDSEEEETETILRTLSAQCVTDMEKKKDKCTMACFWAHEDVCDRLTCSVRSQIAFRKECEYNCRKMYDHNACF